MKVRLPALMLVCAVVMVGCGSNKTNDSEVADVASTPATEPVITFEGPTQSGGPEVMVGVEILNATPDEFRFMIHDLVMIYPDGSERSPFVSEGDPEYVSVKSGGLLATGYNFYLNEKDAWSSKYMPGDYTVTYDGEVVLEEKL